MPDIVTKPLIGTLEDLPDYVHRHHIDVVYMALALQEDMKAIDLIKKLENTTACVYFVPNITAFSLIQAKVSNFEGIPLIAVSEMPWMTPQIWAKRLTDIVVSVIALTLAAPLILAIVIVLLLTSPGPILCQQKRYGFNGQTVTLYRFRTTKTHLAHQATHTPPRITRMGAFLRKTQLESLPQLVSVLQGHMSIVGPRPQVVAYCAQQRKYAHRYRLGYGVKPGLTGLAQIHGFAEEDETYDLLQQRLAYDLDYLQNWSFWLDLEIMIKTAFTLLNRRRASY
jgi:putative colanic acid biosynthesis UDP-glucose lipid carrier transferase